MEAVTRKLDFALSAKTPDFLTTYAPQVAALRKLEAADRQGLIERVAYTWFNRLAALRFMDAHGWHPFRARVLTAASAAETQPELLKLTRTGALPAELQPHTNPSRLNDLLDGKIPSPDAQGEVYRSLVLAACHFYHALLPNVFEKLDDETELLLPDDLLTEHSTVHGFRTEISDADCSDGQRANVEIIGWLYQFYISEKKDQVMARKSAVPTEDIPAVTQLFTPHWIVRYLVENSLGRLWLLNRPQSKLRDHMPYYIDSPSPSGVGEGGLPSRGSARPDEGRGENDYIKITKPEEIRLMDDACGSGHMLTYAFDLFYLIYEEEGYAPSDIPGLILRHNLCGLEICPRAAQLAELALVFKAREKSRRFFQPEHLVRPNIIELREVRFADGELSAYFKALGVQPSAIHPELNRLLHQFEEAKNFGSLIQPCLNEQEIQAVRSAIHNSSFIIHNPDLLVAAIHAKVLRVLEQAEALTQRYHVVVANPPYMGRGNFNGILKTFVETHYNDTRGDLYACFAARNLSLTLQNGFISMLTIPNWMSLAVFEEFRKDLLSRYHIHSLVNNGRGLWGSDFGSCAFVIHKANSNHRYGAYRHLFDAQGEVNSNQVLTERFHDTTGYPYFRRKTESFLRIDGCPIAYWVSERVIDIFADSPQLQSVGEPRVGLDTGNNPHFLRLWHEIGHSKIGFAFRNNEDFLASGLAYAPHLKGGEFRKWYGNLEYVLKFDRHSFDELSQSGNRLPSKQYYFREGLTWTRVSIGRFAIRYSPTGFVFNSACPTIFAETKKIKLLLCLLTSKLVDIFVRALSPTVNYQAGEIRRIPLPPSNCEAVAGLFDECVSLARSDWNNFEISWDFHDQPLLRPGLKGATLAASWQNWESHCQAAIHRMQELETENNRLFIAAYGLQDELKPEVPEDQITLARADARKDMAAFLSYAVGCMMGRYSLDAPGLILANAGDTVEDYTRIIAEKRAVSVPSPTGVGEGSQRPDEGRRGETISSGAGRGEVILHNSSFIPDSDGIIPVLDGEWFEDDIVARTRDFLRATFGETTLRENLRFIEDSLGKDLRKYFLNDFYKDHLQTYKKRPIYWLVQSPKKGFSVLIYLHRYTKDTMNLVLNRYLRDYQVKLRNRLAHVTELQVTAATAKTKTEARKEVEKLTKVLAECDEWERQTMLPLAQARIGLDLDDGVKTNYLKLGEALAPIPGLAAKEEE